MLNLIAAVEDYQRHVVDAREGARQYQVFFGTGNRAGKARGFHSIRSADIRVGHVVKVLANQPIPADLLFFHSSNPVRLAQSCLMHSRAVFTPTWSARSALHREVIVSSRHRPSMVKRI